MSIRRRAMSLSLGLRVAVEQIRPDLIIRDATELAAWVVVAEKYSIPQVSYDVSAHWSVTTWDKYCGEQIVELREANGLGSNAASPACGMYNCFHINNCPPSLLNSGDQLPVNTHFVQPIFLEDVRSSNRLTPRLPSRHLYIAFGSVYIPPLRRYSSLIEECLRAYSVISVNGTTQPSPLLWQAPYVPQTPCMPGCATVVCHGGRSTVLTALRFGVPVVCLPIGSDHFAVSKAVERCGAGVSTTWDDAGLFGKIDAVASGWSYQESAAAVAQEIATMPSLEVFSRTLISRFFS